jgi:hypothetical protein
MPLVEFWQLVAGGELPRRATVDASGTLPSAALRYCEPARTASALGYYLYPPFYIAIRMNASIEWSYEFDGPGSLGEEWLDGTASPREAYSYRGVDS